MLKNKIYSTSPKTIHCPQCEHNDKLLKIFMLELTRTGTQVVFPEDLGIISWDSKGGQSILKKSLKFLKVDATFLGKDMIWANNRLKINLTNDFLKTTSKKYVMGIDAYDALLVGDPAILLEDFKQTKLKLIFNATPGCYPPVKELIEYELKLFPNKIWQHLNAGVWIGETEYCRYFFGKLLSYYEQAMQLFLEDGKMGEQILVKLAFQDEFPLVSIDWKCQLFQVIRESACYPNELKINRGIEINGVDFDEKKYVIKL